MATGSPHPVVVEDKDFERDANTSTHSTTLSEKEQERQLDPDVEHGLPVTDTTEDVGEKAPPETTTDHDPNIVDWDGPNDPQKALNWSNKKKWSNVAIISSITFLTPLASSMVAPATPLIMEEFNTTNTTVASFIVSIYVLGYALGPLFLAPCSEVWGRLPVYHVCNFMFVVWTIGT